MHRVNYCNFTGRDKMKLKGSLTIEASVVMVTVILCIASIITFAMGLRDETVSSADIRIEAIKARMNIFGKTGINHRFNSINFSNSSIFINF